MDIITPAQWKASWSVHLDQYLAVPPRTGFYLEMLFPDRSLSFLEIGGGSLRDANYLAQRGYETTGSDFVPELVAAAAAHHNNPQLRTLVLDAFDTKLADNTFDVSYHNGVIGCFCNDDIARLLREQARITRQYLIAIVHCAHNNPLCRLFAEKVQADPIYGLRFFTYSEICSLIEPFGPTKLYPFGGPLDRRILPNARLGQLPLWFRHFFYRTLARLTPMSTWERILVATRVAK